MEKTAIEKMVEWLYGHLKTFHRETEDGAYMLDMCADKAHALLAEEEAQRPNAYDTNGDLIAYRYCPDDERTQKPVPAGLVEELKGDFTRMLHVDGEFAYIDELNAIISRYSAAPRREVLNSLQDSKREGR